MKKLLILVLMFSHLVLAQEFRASVVRMTGTFNGWDPLANAGTLTNSADQKWEGTVYLPAGSDTLDTTGRAYFGDHLREENSSRTQSHPLYQHIKRLNQIRRAIVALQKAPMSHVREWGSGLSFVRDYNNGQSYAVVGLAIGSEVQITVTNIRNGVYKDAITGGTITVTSGSISFSVKANSSGIWVLNGTGKIGVDGIYLR
jgi:hypothetical protein